MYAQVEKSKENNNRPIAYSGIQKKSNNGQGLGFVDNRPKTVIQRVIWSKVPIEISNIDKTILTKIYLKLVKEGADNAMEKKEAKDVEGNKGGFNDDTKMRITEDLKKQGITKTCSEIQLVKTLLDDKKIGSAIKARRTNQVKVPNKNKDLVKHRNAIVKNSIYYHATEKSMVNTILDKGLTTQIYREKINSQQNTTYKGLAQNATQGAEQYMLENKYSVYVTGRKAEAEQYKKAIDKKKGYTGEIIYPILTNPEDDFVVDAESTGLKTPKASGNMSNYYPVGKSNKLNDSAKKVLKHVINDKSDDDKRTPEEVFISQLS